MSGRVFDLKLVCKFVFFFMMAYFQVQEKGLALPFVTLPLCPAQYTLMLP